MSCEVYSNGSNLTVEHSMSTLPAGFCPTTWQEVFNQIPLSIIGTLQGQYSSFTIGDTTPSPSDQDKLWFRLDSTTCEPLGWFIYYNGAWKLAVPYPGEPGMISAYYSATMAGYKLVGDGGTFATMANLEAQIVADIEALGIYDADTTPFWRFCNGSNSTPDLRDRTIIGAGNAAVNYAENGVALTGRYVGAIMGSETHQLSTSELPADIFSVNSNIGGIVALMTSNIGDLGIGGSTPGYYKVVNRTSTPPGPFNVPGTGYHNNMQPSMALAYMMRTTRKY